MEKINVKISKTGEIEYNVQGIKGKKCTEVTKFIDNVSGKILETKKTGEFCEIETERERIKE